CLLRGLEEDAVAGHEGGGDHACRNREREVPRRDDRADAAWLVAEGVRLAGSLVERRAGSEPDRLPAVVLAEVHRLAAVGSGLARRLAGLEHLRGGERPPAPRADPRRPE